MACHYYTLLHNLFYKLSSLTYRLTSLLLNNVSNINIRRESAFISVMRIIFETCCTAGSGTNLYRDPGHMEAEKLELPQPQTRHVAVSYITPLPFWMFFFFSWAVFNISITAGHLKTAHVSFNATFDIEEQLQMWQRLNSQCESLQMVFKVFDIFTSTLCKCWIRTVLWL